MYVNAYVERKLDRYNFIKKDRDIYAIYYI